jgi:quercetin dioxygenase-like cupin family protein
MKQSACHAMALLLVPWLACNDQAAHEHAKLTASPAPQAAMILPDVQDTTLPSGRRNIYLVGLRNKPGFFVERSVFPAGYRGLPHIHNADIFVTIIEGSAYVALGNRFDTTAQVPVYGPGSFIVIKADQPHYEWFKESCTMQIEGIGPNETFYVNEPVSKK